MVCHLLRDAVRLAYFKRLCSKPDQGKVFEVTSIWSVSNHFLRTGAFTRFADWRFVHRARLGCVPLNGTTRFGNGDKRCRRCGYVNETLSHVLNHCGPHSATIQRRHHAIVNRVAAAIPEVAGRVRKDQRVPGSTSSMRPDIVVIDDVQKKMSIADVAVAFENRYDSFQAARVGKVEKYTPIVEEFRRKGWTVDMGAIVVGSLGGWDPANEATLRMLRISPRYLKLMRRLIVSDTIRWSRDLYVEHLTGNRQYEVETRQDGLRAAEATTANEASDEHIRTRTTGSPGRDVTGPQAATGDRGQQQGASSSPPREYIDYADNELSNTITSLLAVAATARAERETRNPPTEPPPQETRSEPAMEEPTTNREDPIINIHNRNLRVFSIFNRAGARASSGPSPGSTPIARRLRSRDRP